MLMTYESLTNLSSFESGFIVVQGEERVGSRGCFSFHFPTFHLSVDDITTGAPARLTDGWFLFVLFRRNHPGLAENAVSRAGKW